MIGRFSEDHRSLGSFVAVAAAVQLLALQVALGVVDAGDLDAEAVHAPADPPPAAAGRFALQGGADERST